jgi:hypothetical protein
MARDRVANDILARSLVGSLFLLADKAPASLSQVPVYDRVGDDIFKTLELPGNKGTAGLVLSESQSRCMS